MDQSASSQPSLRSLVDRVRCGNLSRRQFMIATGALGIGTAAATLLATTTSASAQEASPSSSPAASPAAATSTAIRPEAGTDSQKRGGGGELRIIQSQAPSVLAAHSATGSKDFYAGSLVMEPLLAYLEDGSLFPLLAETIPSVADGTVAKDLTSVAFTLKKGVLWSDGQPLTTKDLIFTWQWVTDIDNSSIDFDTWSVIKSIDAKDDLTAVITFTQPQVAWFEPFTGYDWGVLYPAHVFNNDPKTKNDSFLTAPIGTGPFKVDTFSPNDLATFSANDKYREATKPFFAKVTFKGGGDAVSAGRAVVQTGEYDYAWNVQAEPEIIKQLNDTGKKGHLFQTVDTTVESIYLNFSDPNKEVDGQRSQKDTPHPFLTDAAVRQAMNLSVRRDLISEKFYGDAKLAEKNVLTGVASFTSPNTSWKYDLDAANKVLDDAGWAKDGDVRKKGGVELSVKYASPINQVRQKTQEVIKQDLEKIGFKVELVQIDPNIFFDSGAGNDQNGQHFYWDFLMQSSGPPSSIPVKWINKWYSGKNGENIAQKENNWSKANIQRWQNADFDKLYEELLVSTTPEGASRILIAMNDLIVKDVAVIPIVHRPFFNAIGNRLRVENVGNDNGFSSPYWNIANWNLAEGQ